jgi:hypothetical protein
MDDETPTNRPTSVETPLPEQSQARVRSVQWLDEPLPTTAPRAERRGRGWLWLVALVVASAIAFVVGLAIATDGFTPLDGRPAAPQTPVP